MNIETSNFGTIDIKEGKIITFEKPILGFEEYTDFTIIENPDDNVFCWLQSIEEPGLSFIITNPLQFIDKYEVVLTDKFKEKLAVESLGDIVVNTIIVIGKEGQYVTTNLKAPIVINTSNNRAGQIVLEKDYPTRFYLFEKKAAV